MTYVLAFGLFLLAVAGMAVGVILAGKRLNRSCGGVDPSGENLGDCLCARREAEVCPSEDESGLVEISQLGYPGRTAGGGAPGAKPAGGTLSV